MKITLRNAVPKDAKLLYNIKEQLRLDLETSSSKQLGGFLLGTSLDEYRAFIEQDVVIVAEWCQTSKLVGFAIVMQHESLANSVLMERAEQVQWEKAFHTQFDSKRFAFFEQLGMLPNSAYRVYAKYLAFSVTHRIFQSHESLFTTVLQYPVVNTAALSFIKVVGFDWVGVVDEVYPEVGRIRSDVYHLDRNTFEKALDTPRFRIFIERAQRLGYL